MADIHRIVIDARIRRTSTGRYVDRLIEHLQDIDKENNYTVLVQSDDTWQPTSANFKRANCDFAQFSFNPLDQIKFPALLRSLKPDLVHYPMNQQPIFYRGKVVTSTLDTTMLHFTRAGKTPLPIFWLKMAGYRFLFWYSNKKSAAVITITNYVKKELEQKYPFVRGKITTTHCASEPPLNASAKKPDNIEAPFIFYVGAAFPHKNLETLIKAFEIILKTKPNLKLILAGKKEYYYEKLQEFANQSPAKDSIIFTGFISDEELKWLYQNAEAYVFPSLSEGFGLPGLEAMVHGCPVVSSSATCLPEVYGYAAQYFHPKSAEDIAEKTLEVLNNPDLRKKLIARGYIQVKKFSWRKMAEQTLDVYRSVL